MSSEEEDLRALEEFLRMNVTCSFLFCSQKGILGAFALAVKSGFRENLHAVFCLAENAVGPKAQRPDDVVTMYSGRTVEVNNTDAEGRLVLGDGVAFAKNDLKVGFIFV